MLRRTLVVVSLLFSLVSAQDKAVKVADKSAVAAAMKEGQMAVQDGDWAAGATAFRKATELDGSTGRAWQMLGYCLHAEGKLDEALQVHLKATEFNEVAPVASYNVACVHSLKGSKELALEWLQKAVALGFNDRTQLVNDADFESLRGDERFKKLVEGLSDVMQAYVVTTERKSARVAYFSGKGSPGQVAIEFGVAEWQDKYDDALASAKFVGKKWRLGSDFWTTLDTSLPLKIGGVEIPPGYWYLTVEHKGDMKFVLGVHDPVEVRKLRIDPFRAELVKGGIEVPLQYAAAAKPHPQLDLGIKLPAGEKANGTLHLHFGGHELTAPATIGVGK